MEEMEELQNYKDAVEESLGIEQSLHAETAEREKATKARECMCHTQVFGQGPG